MTCIVGLVDSEKGRIWIGGDSAGVGGSHIRIRLDEKVFTKNNMVFGCTTSFRMGQLIRYSLKIPQQEQEDDFSYLCTDFISALKKCLEENDYKEGGKFLLGYRGNLYQIEGDFQVAKHTYGFDACGSGEQYALGSLHILKSVSSLSPESKVEYALDAASEFSTDVCKPYTIKYA